MTAELLRLAERCEKETAGSRELDADILRAIGLSEKQERHCREWCRQNGRTDLTRERYIAAWAPDVTFDLDSAVSLVPEGFGWIVGNGRTRPDEPLGGACITSLDGKTVIAESESATPALALTAAALRALASRDDERGGA